tara:strand:- start:3915 stop:4766 length:852 start_codon:yes stop_codon:yes gene_type:complete
MPSEEIIPFIPSTLETIDTAVYKFLDKFLDPHTMTNSGRYKIPVLWLGTERVYQIKNDKALRDKTGKLRLPLITLTRTALSADDAAVGSYQSYFPQDQTPEGGRVAITRVIKQDKTRNFANADTNRRTKGDPNRLDRRHSNKKVVYETLLIPKPTYVTCTFEVHIRTEYQQQMNDILPALIVDQNNVAVVEDSGYQYELFIQEDFGLDNNIGALGTDERMFTAKIVFKVFGYLIGDGGNNTEATIIRKQNAVEWKISRERVIVGEKRPWAKNIPGDDGKFREF